MFVYCGWAWGLPACCHSSSLQGWGWCNGHCLKIAGSHGTMTKAKEKKSALRTLTSTLKCLACKEHMPFPFTAHWLQMIMWLHSIQEVSEGTGLLCAQNMEIQKYLMSLIFCWSFCEQTKVKNYPCLLKENDPTIIDKGMLLLIKRVIPFFFSPHVCGWCVFPTGKGFTIPLLKCHSPSRGQL